jgi:IS30 family transposase
VVECRSRLGDWEVETMIGKGHQETLISLTERKSPLSLTPKSHAGMTLLKPLRLTLHRVTSDK